MQSLRGVPTSYSVAFQPAAALPAGVTISVGIRALAIPAGGSVLVPVTLTVNPATLQRTPDPTKTMSGSSLDTWIAEASGWVVLSPRDGRGSDLRVSVYAAPRRASTMSAAGSATVSSATGQGTLALSGNGFGTSQSTGPHVYTSLLSATQLQATSPELPLCSQSAVSGCLPFTDDRAADIRYVGTSSDAPFCAHGGHGIETCVDSHGQLFDAYLNVGVSTWGPWRTPASFAQFYVFWNVNSDPAPDALTVNTRLTTACPDDANQRCDTDELVAQTYVPCHQAASQCDLELSDGSLWRALNSASGRPALNDVGSEVDTSPYDSDAMLLPVSLNSLEVAGWNSATTPRVQYWMTTSTVESAAQVTQGGSPLGPIDAVGSQSAPLQVTVASPALSAIGDTGLPELNSDRAGSAYTLRLRENSAALLFDLPAGTPQLLLIHHDNLTGARAQLVSVRRSATASITVSSTSITTTTHDKVSVTVAPSGATGQVSCRDGTTILTTVTLSGGRATCTLPLLARGTHSINAVYLGNASYAAVRSNSVTVTVH